MTTTNETVPSFYVSGPLSPEELVEVLRTALVLVREDSDHDVFTLLDVLAEDHYPEMSRDATYQVARAVLKFLTGIAADETREPVLALHLWHRRNLDAAFSGTTLERALAETVQQFDSISGSTENGPIPPGGSRPGKGQPLG
jgi:hypothetical protein